MTGSKLVLLTTGQDSKSKDKLLGKGIATLSGKQIDWEGGRLVFQRIIFTQVRIQAYFIQKGEGVWLVVAHSSFQESFVLAAVYMGQVTGFLCYSLSATFYLYMNGKVLFL